MVPFDFASIIMDKKWQDRYPEELCSGAMQGYLRVVYNYLQLWAFQL